MSQPTSLVASDGLSKLSTKVNGGPCRVVPYSLEHGWFEKPFGRHLSDLQADLLDVAAAVYGADRLIPRPSGAANKTPWFRRLVIRLPVRDIKTWRRPEVSAFLSDALTFLTQDDWQFDFVPREVPTRRLARQELLFPPVSPVGMGLFSGGLDSLAGLASEHNEQRFHSMVVLGSASSSRLLSRQRQLLKAAGRSLRLDLRQVIVPFRLCQNEDEYNLNERSQRTRGFFFSCLGIVAGLLAGTVDLQIYENGIGALSLPLTAAQLGAHNTRSTHPVALRKLELFLQSLFDLEVRLQLPLFWRTKSESCQHLEAAGLRTLALRTVSCDGFPPRRSDGEQCGVCSSCVLRRQALWEAGIREDLTEATYRYDVLGSPEMIPEEKIAVLADMIDQARRIAILSREPNAWQETLIEYPGLEEACAAMTSQSDEASVREKPLRLLRAYGEEWARFPARPDGWLRAA